MYKSSLSFFVFGFLLAFLAGFIAIGAYQLFFEPNELAEHILFILLTSSTIGLVGGFGGWWHFKQSGALLQELEETQKDDTLLREILDSFTEGVYICSGNREIEYMNDSLKKKIGEQAIGQKCYKAIYNKNQVCEWCKLDTLREKQVLQYNHFIEEQGQHLDVHNVLLSNGSKLTIYRDITQLINTEQEKDRMLMSFQRAEEIASIGRWEFYVKKKIFIASKGARKIYGIQENAENLSAELVQNIPLPEYRKQMDTAMLDLITKGTTYNVVFQIKKYDNQQIRTIRSQAVYNKQKQVVFGIIRDITEEEHAKQRLIEATEKAKESNRLKTAFLNNISHEFRTPLNGIMGFAELLCLRNIDENKRSSYTRVIKESSERLLDIVTDIVEISKIQSKLLEAKLEYVPLEKLFGAVVAEQKPKAEKKGLLFETMLEKNCTAIHILTDYDKLYKAIKHLIENSIKFTPKGKIVLMCTYSSNNELIIRIEDTGIGIAPEMHQTIFEPFRQVETGFSRNYGGNGIGLSLVKSYVELLKGNILLKSEPNSGTSIDIILKDIQTNSNQKKQLDKEQYLKHLGGKTILIAEDESSNELYLTEVIEHYGAKVIVAYNGQQAIDYCRNRENIDLILMDLKMPQIDGYEAASLIRSFRPEIAIVAQTAYPPTENEKFGKSDFDDYILKPIDEDKLLRTMIRFL